MATKLLSTYKGYAIRQSGPQFVRVYNAQGERQVGFPRFESIEEAEIAIEALRAQRNAQAGYAQVPEQCLEGCECDDCMAETPHQPVIEETQEASTIVSPTNTIVKRAVQCVKCGDWLEEWEIHPASDTWIFCIPCGEKFFHGRDFLRPAQESIATVEVEQVEASTEAQPTEPVITSEQIAQYAERCHSQRQEALSKRIAILKAQAKHEELDWPRVIFHAVPYDMRGGAYHDESIKAHQLDYITKYLDLPRCSCGNHTSKHCPRCKKPLCSYCEWGTADMRLNACRECALIIRKEQEANQKAELEAAWLSLQSVPSYFEREMLAEEEISA